MEIKQNLVSSNKYDIKCPYAMTPKYITIHGTGNDSPAKNEISYMISNNNEVSFHVAVDDVEAIQGIPFSKNAWHCGDGGSGTGNRQSIGIEICYDLSGGSKFDKAEDNAAIITAQLMKQFNIPISNVVQHNNWSGKDCPHSIRIKSNGWNNFIAKVQTEYNKLNEVNKVDVKYQAHIQNIGWQGVKKNGEVAGTEGNSLRMEALQIIYPGVQFRVHVEGIGWTSWRSSGELAGTLALGLRIEAVEIKHDKLEFAVQIQNQGWTGWFSNTALGTTGKSLRLEAIMIREKK